MTKAIETLKLTNKTGTGQRLVSNAYTEHLSGLKFRYESLTPTNSAREASSQSKEKALQLAYLLMIDKIDIRVSDRIFVSEDNKTFVVCGVQGFDEIEVSHLEVLIREVGSHLHEEVELLKLGTAQPNFDPVFKMWSSNKSYESTSVLALVDRLKPGMFPDLESAGRITDADYLITFDLPITIDVKDKVRFKGMEYFVQRVEELPYQTMCVVKKVTPNGRQFPV